MKKLILILAVFLPLAINAQSSYQEAIEQGDQAFRNSAFKTAINKYFAAEAFDPSKKEVIKNRIDQVFERIEALRQEAEAAKKEAEQREIEAKIAQRRSDSLLILSNKMVLMNERSLDSISALRIITDRVTEENRLAKEDIALLIQLNDFEGLADFEIKKDSFDQANEYYNQAFLILGKMDNKDSTLVRKQKLLEQKTDEVKQFLSNIRAGDTYLESNNFSSALTAYLELKDYSFGANTLKTRLNNLENQLTAQLKELRKAPLEDYQKTISLSAEALAFNGYKKEAQRRIANIMKVRPWEYSFIKDPEIRTYAMQYDRSVLARLKFNLAFQGDFGAQSLKTPFTVRSNGKSLKYDQPVAPKWDLYSFGLFFDINSKFGVGFDASFSNNYRDVVGISFDTDAFQFANISNDTEGDSEGFELLDIRFYGTYTLLSSFLKKTKTNRMPFSVQALVGIERKEYPPNASIHLQKTSNSFIHPLSDDERYDNPLGISSRFNGFEFGFDFPDGYSSFTANSEGSRSLFYNKNTNIIGGFRLNLEPFNASSGLGFFMEITRKYALYFPNSENTNPFQIKDVLSYVGFYEESRTDFNQYLIDHVDQYWEDIEFELSRKQFLYGWSFRFGLSYDF